MSATPLYKKIVADKGLDTYHRLCVLEVNIAISHTKNILLPTANTADESADESADELVGNTNKDSNKKSSTKPPSKAESKAAKKKAGTSKKKGGYEKNPRLLIGPADEPREQTYEGPAADTLTTSGAAEQYSGCRAFILLHN